VRQAVSDQARAEGFVRDNRAPRSDARNINRPMPIRGSDMKYGDTPVIERSGANGERSFADTDGVAGANPAMGGASRPGVLGANPTTGRLYDSAAEAERVARAREEYRANTTMDDGTRVFGRGAQV